MTTNAAGKKYCYYYKHRHGGLNANKRDERIWLPSKFPVIYLSRYLSGVPAPAILIKMNENCDLYSSYIGLCCKSLCKFASRMFSRISNKDIVNYAFELPGRK